MWQSSMTANSKQYGLFFYFFFLLLQEAPEVHSLRAPYFSCNADKIILELLFVSLFK